MALATGLIGLGMPVELAQLLGNTPATLAGVGTSQAGATSLTSSMAQLTTSSGQTAFVFRSTASITRLYFLFNTTATTALIYPAVGGTIQGASQDAAFSIAQNKGAIFWHFSSLVWVPVLSA